MSDEYTENDFHASVGKYGPSRKPCYNTVSDQGMIWHLLASIPFYLGGVGGYPGLGFPGLRSPIQWGVPNENIYQAILAFQRAHVKDGLSVDGHVDPHEKTLRLLLKLAKENEFATPALPQYTPPPDPTLFSGTRVYINPQTDAEEGPLEIPAAGVHWAFTGFTFLELFGKYVVKLGIHANPAGLAGDVLLTLIMELHDPPPDLSDPNTLAEALKAACDKAKRSELFLPFCGSSNHSSRGDKVLNAGFWHGNLFFDYWNAYNAASAHLQPEVPESVGKCGVIRYQRGQNLVDFAPIESE